MKNHEKRIKFPRLTPDDICEFSGYSIHVEKITDKYDEWFPFSDLEEFLDDMFDSTMDWSNIDDLGFLVISFRGPINLTKEKKKLICDFINTFNDE